MSDPIPLSALSLDHPEPPIGWAAFLAARDIPTELDDLGRWSVSRAMARLLLAEQRDQQEAAGRARIEAEQRAVEADRRFRARLHPGIPASAFPDGVLPVVAMTAAGRDAQPRRLTPLQEALGSETMTYHPIREEDDGWVVGGGDG